MKDVLARSIELREQLDVAARSHGQTTPRGVRFVDLDHCLSAGTPKLAGAGEQGAKKAHCL